MMVINSPDTGGRFRRVANEGFWVALGQASAVLGSLVGVRLLTSLLDPAQYGELALGITLAVLVNQVIFGPIGNGITRFYAPALEKGDLAGYFAASRRLVLQATRTVVLLILFTGVGLLVAGRLEWMGLAVAALIFSIPSGCNGVMNGIQNAARQRSIVALHQGIDSWTRFLTAAGLMMLLQATSTVAMIGYGLGAILVLSSQYLFLRRIIPQQPSGMESVQAWRGQIWKFSSPIAVWGVFTWAQQASDRWALGCFGSTQDVGLYAVLFQLGCYPMSLISGFAMQLLAPILFQRAGDAGDCQRNASVNRISWHLTAGVLAVTIAACLGAQLFHIQIFRVLVAEEYGSVSYLLPWMILVGGVFAAGETLAVNLMCQMKTDAMKPVKIVTAVLGVLFNFIGAYWYGIIGLVSAGVLFAFIYFIWTAVVSFYATEG